MAAHPMDEMNYAEVVVNVPIRRSFSQPPEPPGVDRDALIHEPGVADSDTPRLGYRTFHYRIPPQLRGQVRPGHLVWVPFGRQTLQGFVTALAHSAPVATKDIQRLARPEPVLTPVQLALAAHIADYYIAPISEALKLFVPPGLLNKQEDAVSVRAKREIEVELITDESTLSDRMLGLGRETHRAAVLRWFIERAGCRALRRQVRDDCGLGSNEPIMALVQRGLLAAAADEVWLAVPVADARAELLALRGADKYQPVLSALQAADGPVWKSDLYAAVATDLATLRALEAAGLVRLTERVRFRDPLAGMQLRHSPPPALTEEQVFVWACIRGAAEQLWRQAQRPRPDEADARFLLHGVTGSGKTEVYLRALEHALSHGRQAIVLVPEIALTPQTVARFAARFPGRVTVVHSELSPGERYDVWRLLRDGAFDIVIGPRSALFAPLPRLGLIVIDEAHEGSYKQDAEEWGSFTVFYDARTVARKLAELTGSLLILGSATPDLESYYAAGRGELHLLTMPSRVLGHGAEPQVTSAGDAPVAAYADLPPVEIVDMRQELRAGNRSIFSRSLQAELHATLDAGEQAILFLNRRGSSTFVMCRDCGDVQQCTRCEAPLTYHERANVLICHHCNRRVPIPDQCPVCGSQRIKYFGSGTQRIEDYVHQIAPRARLLRWDADTTGRKGSHAAILAHFADHEADILIGTQMIAKGLDLPLVTLVGIVAADVGLYLPDFRSGERTFQLLTQVAGRAGRSQRGGRVVIQTYTPEHYAIQAAAQHDYAAFYAREIAFRQAHGYPPIHRLARLVYWDRSLAQAQAESARMAERLHVRIQSMGLIEEAGDLMGPAPAFFARYRGQYRWQLLLRSPDPGAILRGVSIPFGWRVDIDPVSTL